MLINIWRVGVRRMGPSSFQWCPVTGQGAMGTNWSTGSSVWTWGRVSSLWGWRSPGTGFPWRLWILLLWGYSRPAWMWSCAACCRWPCFGRGVQLDDPQRSLPTLNILCDSVWFCVLNLEFYRSIQDLFHHWLIGLHKDCNFISRIFTMHLEIINYRTVMCKVKESIYIRIINAKLWFLHTLLNKSVRLYKLISDVLYVFNTVNAMMSFIYWAVWLRCLLKSKSKITLLSRKSRRE